MKKFATPGNIRKVETVGLVFEKSAYQEEDLWKAQRRVHRCLG